MIPLDPVPQPIDRVLRGAPGAVALIDRAGAMTYGQAESAVSAMAAMLSRFARGERIATWLPKTRVACLMPLAAARAGLVHVPINPMLKRAQVAHILGDSGAVGLVTQPTRIATLEAGDLPDGCLVIEEEQLRHAGLDPASTAVHAPGAKGIVQRWTRAQGRGDDRCDDLAAILYTSGSTGRPKGVMLSHANLWLGAVSVAHYLRIEPHDRVLGVLPLSFDYGQNQLFSTWIAGGSVAPVDYLVARDVMSAVERFGVTTLAGVPPLWVQLLGIDWPAETAVRLKRLTNSGGALTPPLVKGLHSRFPAADLYPMYGLTEAFRSTYLAPDLVDAHPDAMGGAIPFAEVAVARADGTRADPGEPGELVHAGPLVARGYWNDPERTAARFRPAPAWMASGGMAVWSGDTVTLGDDALFRFVGREDEMIKSAGNRISPLEIEEAVVGDGVGEAVALGVPDERLGQAIMVVAAGNPAQEPAVRARVRRDLPGFMQPVRYEWRDALPRNANGKLDRAGIRAQVLGRG